MKYFIGLILVLLLSTACGEIAPKTTEDCKNQNLTVEQDDVGQLYCTAKNGTKYIVTTK